MDSHSLLYLPLYFVGVGVGVAGAVAVFAYRFAATLASFVERWLDLISQRREAHEIIRIKQAAGLTAANVPALALEAEGSATQTMLEATSSATGGSASKNVQLWVRLTALLAAAGTFLAGIAAVLAVLVK